MERPSSADRIGAIRLLLLLKSCGMRKKSTRKGRIAGSPTGYDALP